MSNHNSKVRIAKTRSLALPVLVVLALTGAAHAQQAPQAGTDAMLKAKDESDNKAMQQYINRVETDEQYQKTIREQPSAPASNDPWGSVRSTAAPAKPALKSVSRAAKTASGSGKPAGAIKPATGPAASANTTAPKGQ